MIAYCIFYQYIADLPYLFIVKWILLISFCFQFSGWLIIMVHNPKRENNRKNILKKDIIKNTYLKVGQIITQIFCYYFAIYLILMLDKQSILYNYLVLLLFGLMLGYRIAMKVYDYLNENQENTV